MRLRNIKGASKKIENSPYVIKRDKRQFAYPFKLFQTISVKLQALFLYQRYEAYSCQMQP